MRREAEGDDSAGASVAEALEQARPQTVSRRQIEGANLAKDLGTRLEAVKVQNEVIREMAAGSRHEYLGRYKARIEELAGIDLRDGEVRRVFLVAFAVTGPSLLPAAATKEQDDEDQRA